MDESKASKIRLLGMYESRARELERRADERDAETTMTRNPYFPSYWEMGEISDRDRAEAAELRAKAEALRNE